MRNRALQNTLYGVVLAVWVTSFFLPSINLGAHNDPGWKAAGLSATMLFTLEKNALGMHLYFGSFWIANLFMLASPLGLHRARRGKAGVFLALMMVWDLLSLSCAGYAAMSDARLATLRVGYWVWEATLWAMTLVLWTARRQSKTP